LGGPRDTYARINEPTASIFRAIHLFFCELYMHEPRREFQCFFVY
jgi:hypothetical protein